VRAAIRLLPSPAVRFCLAVIAGSLVLGPAVGWLAGPRWIPAYRFLALPVIPVLLVAVPVILLRHRARLDSGRPGLGSAMTDWRLAWRAARENELSRPRLASLAAALLLAPPLLATFAAWKASIPEFQAYRWDAAMAAADRWVHFGRYPHEWLAPLFARPALVDALDVVYILWYALFLLGPAAVAWAPESAWRRRTLLVGAMSWILLGVATATAFASAGPCYYAWAAGVTGAANPYEPLMSRLAEISASHRLFALEAQEFVRSNYRSGTTVGQGISAFPSMHVGIAALAAIAAWERSRGLGAVLAAFALLIQLGSVVLGWHYAVDGYGAALGVALLWWLAKRWDAALAGAAERRAQGRTVATTDIVTASQR
jgi:hypothetical protein